MEEYLLRNGVEVTVIKDSGEIFSLIFDILFYLIFFGVIIVAFRKFISPNTFKVVHKTGVCFDDVVGMDRLKQDMKQIMQIMENPVEYAKKGIRMPKGILLEGEPGNGKTLFAKALAGEAKINFIPAKATDFESMFMAIGPMKVKLLFKKARHRAPCIVFIDEFDGIGTIRNYSGSAIETENTRIVTALLNELDGFERGEYVFIAKCQNNVVDFTELKFANDAIIQGAIHGETLYYFEGWDPEVTKATKSQTYTAKYNIVDVKNIDAYFEVVIPDDAESYKLE